MFPGDHGVTVLLTGEDPFLVLPVTAERLPNLCQGGELRLEITWPMSMDTLSLAQNCVPRKDMQALEKQGEALKARTAELEVQAGTLVRQVETLEDQANGFKISLTDLEITLAEKTRHLSQQTEEVNRLRETLVEIHTSTIWRWSRPYVNTVNWLRQRLRPSPRPAKALLTPRPIPVPTDLKIDVIVPVYRGLTETRNCIESLLRDVPMAGHEIVVINDASPESELTEYLTGLAASGHITLLTNEENLGFVGTVNRGMALHPDRDVVLLNSDTEVAGDWLDRLVRCAYDDRMIGTVTPFSNNATICSYPRFCQDNPLPEGWSLDALDNLFRQLNDGKWIEIPTAIGFCMYIRRDCLHDIGLFDMANFGKGYGEENDFCMRATAAGWYHVLCADTFVYHAGGVSFAETQDPRKVIATDMMRRLHPSYEELVHRYIAEDPVRPFRLSVDAARLLGRGRPVVLFVTHGIGGGTDKHIHELAERLADCIEILVLNPLADGQHELVWLREGEALKLFFHLPNDYARLCGLLRELHLERIHFHHTKSVDSTIWNLPEDLSLPYDYTVHDYYAVCPQVSLTNLQNRYCGEPDEAGCNRCLRLAPAPGGVDIQTWREYYARLLEGAERVFAPSQDVAARVNLGPHFLIQRRGTHQGLAAIRRDNLCINVAWCTVYTQAVFTQIANTGAGATASANPCTLLISRHQLFFASFWITRSSE
jgi:GT2 family glycosyltransferase